MVCLFSYSLDSNPVTSNDFKFHIHFKSEWNEVNERKRWNWLHEWTQRGFIFTRKREEKKWKNFTLQEQPINFPSLCVWTCARCQNNNSLLFAFYSLSFRLLLFGRHWNVFECEELWVCSLGFTLATVECLLEIQHSYQELFGISTSWTIRYHIFCRCKAINFSCTHSMLNC